MNGREEIMKIGVDARSLSEPIAGIGRYTLFLLREMIVNSSHEWVLYSHKPIIHGDWDRSRVKIRTLKSFIKIKGIYFAWLQLILPFWLSQDQITLFWSPAHRLPWYMPKGITTVITIHDLVWKYFPETMRPFGKLLDSHLMPFAIKNTDRIIASSISTANDVFDESPSARSKTKVIYLGNSFTRKKKSEINNRKYLLFVGTLEPRKNLQRLLEAYVMFSHSVRKQYPLLIVGGDGWGNQNLPYMINQLGLNDSVKVLGFVSNQKLEEVYCSAYLFIMPSLYEGFGLPIVEAMSFGLPVVTSNNSSMPEIGGDAAILVNPNSSSSIYKGINKVLSSNELWRELSSNAFKRSKLFSWHQSSKEMLEVFEDTASSKLNERS
jgi:glycosyltransferase involved in cell wall biosynthesis